MVKGINFRTAVLAGFLATLVMTVVMYSMLVFGLPAMDIMAALGGVFPWNISPYVMGAIVHFGLGVSLAFIYALLFHWLWGPGWFRGAIFSLAPWVFAITLLGPSLNVAGEFLKGKDAIAANPCSVTNPCAVRPTNPCSVKLPTNPCMVKQANPCSINPCAAVPSNPCGVVANPCAVSSNPCAVKPVNPCGVSANPCAAVNPCGGGSASAGGPSPQAMSLFAHLLFGVVLGAVYRPTRA